MSLDGKQLGRYHLLHLLGRGAMGEVYLAEDPGIHRQVAIKVIRSDTQFDDSTSLNNEALRLFEREMHTIAHLNHPHILPLFDYGQETLNSTQMPYMVMPFCSDGSLSIWLRQRNAPGALLPIDVAHIVMQAAGALQHAHDQQIIHRDVKPSNFLIRLDRDNPRRPDLLLADFGLAKFSDSAASIGQHTIGGTPLYMAPEQWQGHPVLETDQYMLAAMSYELLTGRVPFRGNLQQLMMQHVQGQVQPPSTLNPQVPPALDNILIRGLAKRPGDRFPSVTAFAQAFQAALQQRPSAASPFGTVAGSDFADIPNTATAPLDPEKTQPLAGSIGGIGGIALTMQQQDQLRSAQSQPPIRATATSQQSQSVQAVTTAHDPAPATTAQAGRGVNLTFATRSGLRCSVVLMLGLLIFVVGGAFVSQFVLLRHSGSGSASTGAPTGTVGSRNNATATVAAINGNPYTTQPSTLVLDDTLIDNSQGHKWNTSTSSSGSCAFTGGAYHAIAQLGTAFYDCQAQGSDYSNFTYEVSMTILRGDCGALVFRSNYRFLICTDGSYGLTLKDQASALIQSNSPFVNQGIGKENVIAVVASGSQIRLAINHHFLTTITDSSFQHGSIGVAAVISISLADVTEVAFKNARVWTI